MRSIISREMVKMHVHQQQIAETQGKKIEATLTDGLKLIKRENAVQWKQKMKFFAK